MSGSRAVVSGVVLLSVGVAGLGGCGEGFSWLNQTASLGGDVAGQRGSIRVAFINNTPHRAVFTFGTYDQTDQDSQPDSEQFGPNDYDMTLDPGQVDQDAPPTSDIHLLECARVFAIGSPRLLELIEDNHTQDGSLIEEAFIEGIEFFSLPSEDDDEEEGDDEEDADPVSEGTAPAFEARIGDDFPCGALLIIRLEVDDLEPDAFRIDFEIIPPAD